MSADLFAAQYAERTTLNAAGPVVYFVQAGPEGPIKIGYAKRVADRFGELQTANPEPLILLGVLFDGTRALEARTHLRFAHLRLRGEWFTPADELLDFLAESIEGYPTAALHKLRARRAS